MEKGAAGTEMELNVAGASPLLITEIAWAEVSFSRVGAKYIGSG
jgi:hypothetical protein